MKKVSLPRRAALVALSAALAVSTLAACSDSPGSSGTGPAGTSAVEGSTAAGDDYSEKLEFTVYSLDYPDGFDTMPMIAEAKEKFNVDFKVQQVAWDNWDETTRTLAATDSLPEVLAWYNVIYGEYKSYAEQGVLKALPNDLSKWPKLKEVSENMPVFEHLRIDGSMYCFPKINPNQPFNHFRNQQVIYRRDWAEAMGYDFAPVQELTYEEFVAYLKDLKAKDPGGLGDKLVPMDYYSGGLTWSDAVGWWNKNFTSYYQKDGEYVWGGRDESTLQGILELKKLYDEGLLMKDSYADATSAGSDRFTAGRSGVWFGDVALSALVEGFGNDMPASVPGFKDEDLGTMVIRMPDGKFHCAEFDNWWTSFAFSSSCSDEIMNRWLDIGNWLMEDEQVEKYAYGIPEEDWTKDADGNVTLNWTAEDVATGGAKNYIVEQRYFQKFFMLEGQDKWLEGNPAKRDYLQDDVFKAYYEYLGDAESKGEVEFYPVDYDVKFFSGTNMDQYGDFNADVQTAVIQAVVSDDAEASWKEFLAVNESKIDAVLQELNEGLLHK